MSKYGNVKCTADGHSFDSYRERDRYFILKDNVRRNEICELEMQPRYDFRINDIFIGFYKADFRYHDNRTGETVIEDAKGKATTTYRLKKKMMRAFHGVEIIEV